MPGLVRDAREQLRQQAHTPTDEAKALAYYCTIVNMLPMAIVDEKPHLLPSTFKIPAAEGEKFGILHIGEAIHYVPDPFEENRSFRVVTPPHEMARSVVEDWSGAHISLSEDAGPGLFWVHGKKSAAQVIEQHPDLVRTYHLRQKQWYSNLVSLADADWEKNKNKMTVSDLQRMAARAMGITKEWVEFVIIENKKCPFCTFQMPVEAIKCPNCKEVVDQAMYKKLTGG